MPRPRGSGRERQRALHLATGGGRLVGYVRVSTEVQAEHGHSLYAQEERLREACARWGYECVGIYADVASGGRDDRAGLRDAMSAVERGDAEGLVFAKLDRVTRSMRHGAALVEWARAGGHTLASTDEGVMVLRGQLTNEALPFFLALAQVERERISRRTREGLAAARARGVVLGTPVRTKGTDPAAVRARELRASGLTIKRVAEALNREGYRTARGGRWHPGSVYTLLRRVSPEVLPVGGFARDRTQ